MEGGNNYPILVADDDPDIRRLLDRTLSNAGHRVALACDGLEALEICRKEFYPIVISDWLMPEVDGVQLCSEIRKLSHRGYVYIIMLTSKDDKKEIITGLEAGADEYLVKPFQKGELLARLNTGIRILNLERTLKKANEEIKLLSIVDPLTGCYNRGYMAERIPKEIYRAQRYQRGLSIIMCDIDHFKKINDTHGHQAGDEVLKSFVDLLSRTVRKGEDWVARYGGEEFIITLPETDPSKAIEVAEKIRLATSETSIAFGNRSIRITASFGVAGFEAEAVPSHIAFENLIDRADQYLYSSKENGRNRVTGGTCMVEVDVAG